MRVVLYICVVLHACFVVVWYCSSALFCGVVPVIVCCIQGVCGFGGLCCFVRVCRSVVMLYTYVFMYMGVVP